MNITLNSNETNEAIISHISRQGITTDNKSIVVTFTAGRKGNGHRAEVEINDKALTTALEEVCTEEPVVEPDPVPEVVDADPVESAAVTTSLFSNGG